MKKAILIGMLMLSIVLVIFNYDSIFNFLIKNIGIGWVFTDVISKMTVFTLSLTTFLVIYSLFEVKRFKILVVSFSVLLSLGTIFLASPVYVEDYGVSMKSKELDFDLIYTHFPALESFDNYVVVCFFTSSCPFCESTARKFMINKKSDEQPPTFILFPSELPNAKAFLDRTNSNFNFGLISDEDFLSNAGNRFPSVFLVKEGEVRNHWVGSEVNYSVLDYLRSISRN